MDAIWCSEVVRLERSHLDLEGDVDVAKNCIRYWRHFVVGNVRNKEVVVNSHIIFHNLVSEFIKLKSVCEKKRYDLLFEFLALINSIARDCSPFKNRLVDIGALAILLEVIESVDQLKVQEASLRVMRTILEGENSGATLEPSSEMHDSVLRTFSESALSKLTRCFSSSAACQYLVVQIWSVIATESNLAHRLHSVGVIPTLNYLMHHSKPLRITVCALKTITYLLFYVKEAFDSLRSAYPEDNVPELIRYWPLLETHSDEAVICLLGVCRGVLFWRLDQHEDTDFISPDHIALWIIQPITFSFRLFKTQSALVKMVCHVLYLVLQDRPQLHIWAMHANSFVKEVDARISQAILVAKETPQQGLTFQLKEHLNAILKLFSCLASEEENIRLWFGELTMSRLVIESCCAMVDVDSTASIDLDLQKSVCLYVHALSRSVYLHRTLFLNESLGKYFLKLLAIHTYAEPHSVGAKIVKYAAAALSNLVLPFCPLREFLMEPCLKAFVLLATKDICNNGDSTGENDYSTYAYKEQTYTVQGLSDGDPGELTTSWRQLSIGTPVDPISTQVLGVWGLMNATHAGCRVTSSLVLDLMPPQVWVELVGLAMRRHSLTAASKHNQLAHKTLALVRNLLRDKEFIEHVVETHWCYIVQLLISVLESSFSQPVKEQALMVLAHITTCDSTKRRVVGNEDLLEKIKIFMMSQNTQIKAAALSVVSNLVADDLGLPDYRGMLMQRGFNDELNRILSDNHCDAFIREKARCILRTYAE